MFQLPTIAVLDLLQKGENSKFLQSFYSEGLFAKQNLTSTQATLLQLPTMAVLDLSQKGENPRFPSLTLISTPAKIKFLSIEPLIGAVKSLYLDEIDWVIVGGESGAGARPLKKEWVVDIFRQCRANKVKFFFKQWGTPRFNVNQDDPTMDKDSKFYAKGGCQLNGRVYREMPNKIVEVHSNL